MEAVRPAVEMNGGSDAPAVGGGKEVVGELQGSVGKLKVESIGVEEGRRRESDEDRGSPAKGVTAARSFRLLGCQRVVEELLRSFCWTMWCCCYPWWRLRGSGAVCRQ
jgi:hypothetical protein